MSSSFSRFGKYSAIILLNMFPMLLVCIPSPFSMPWFVVTMEFYNRI
jgi:hypothetical protein